jgi:GNAT superfamily N-acetyltransferase
MGAHGGQRSFKIQIAIEDEVKLVLDFHNRYLTEHLWPRTSAEFEDLARKEALYITFDTTGGGRDLVGICYIQNDEEPDKPGVKRVEFGGVYVTDSCRGLGVASALGIVAISNHHVWDPPSGRLIAHVHEANQLPRGMLKRLGFVQNGQEIPPNDKAPARLARNAMGQVVGDLFEFQPKTLAEFADWIEGFQGSIDGKSGRSGLVIALPFMVTLRANSIEALRDLAKKHP